MKEFEEGYNQASQKLKSIDYISKQLGSSLGAEQSYIWTATIEKEIQKTLDDLASLSSNNSPADKLQGFAAEKFHTGTYNINAAIKRSANRATQLEENGLGSVDSKVSDGTEASLKYYKFADKSAKAQATTYGERFNAENSARMKRGQEPYTWEEYCKAKNIPADTKPSDLLYGNQQRVIPKDQLDAAIDYCDKKIAKETAAGRLEEAEKYKELKKLLTDKIVDKDGITSIALTREEAQKIIKLVREGKLDPKELGLDLKSLVSAEDILSEALEAGMSAALLSFILSVAPIVIESIAKLIKDGQLDLDDFKKFGFAAVKGTANGFISGTLSACIMSCCKIGYLGEAFTNANPSVVGSLVALTLHLVEESVLLALGRSTKQQFIHNASQAIDIAAFSTAFGIAATMLFPQATVFSFMIGSFIGSVVGGLVFKAKEKIILSFCLESGCTFFGIVDQNYVLPKEVIERVGVKTFDYVVFTQKKFEYKQFSFQQINTKKSEYNRFSVEPLRRGIIGVSKIGYV